MGADGRKASVHVRRASAEAGVLEIVRGFWAVAQGRKVAGKEGKQIV